MLYRPGKDLISQAELRKGAEIMIGTSPAALQPAARDPHRQALVVRSWFGGRLSYAALPFEGVNWGPVRHHLDGRRISDGRPQSC
jgi:hypothetical protein